MYAIRSYYDLASYFDTVHHRLLIKCVRKRICDKRFLNLLWRIIKAGHVDEGLFRASTTGVPQGGVISPLLSNIMLNEFDQWLEGKYLSSNHQVQDPIDGVVLKRSKGVITSYSIHYTKLYDQFAEYARQNYGVEIEQGRFEKKSYQAGKFDAVVLFNSYNFV